MRLRTEAQARKQSMLPQLEGGLLTEPVIARHFVPTRWLATTGPGFRRTRRRYDAELGCAIGMARGLPRAAAVDAFSFRSGTSGAFRTLPCSRIMALPLDRRRSAPKARPSSAAYSPISASRGP